MYHSSLSVCLTNNMLSGVKSIEKEPNQKVANRTKCVSFFFFLPFSSFSSSDRPVQNCDPFTIPLHKTVGVHQTITFHKFEVSRGTSNRSLKNYCNVSFFMYALAHKALNNKL